MPAHLRPGEIRRLRRLVDACRIGEASDPASYRDFHASRWIRTLEAIRQAAGRPVSELDVLDLGPCWTFSTLLLAELGPRSYQAIGGGRRLDGPAAPPARTEVRTSLGSRSFRIPYVANVDFDAGALPVPDESVDVVLFLEVIEHLILSPERILHEILRVLRPSGVLVLTTDQANSFVKLLKLLALRPIYWPYAKTTYGDRHNREYLRREVAELLEGVGFREVRCETFNMLPYLPEESLSKSIGYRVGNALTCLPVLRRYQRHLLATARKGDPRPFHAPWLDGEGG